MPVAPLATFADAKDEFSATESNAADPPPLLVILKCWIVQVADTTVLILPARSTARTANVCGPSPRFVKVNVDPSANAYAVPSTEYSTRSTPEFMPPTPASCDGGCN